MKYTSTLLKAALFATGLAGIVSEYTLSTLATYFLGDSVFQFTMIVSTMLFSMGLGSRISRRFEKDLLRNFVALEFTLSVLASNITTIVYSVFAIYGETLVIIYLLSVMVGLLIGMEIPLVVRLNQQFESLKVNISSAMENDYYGSLAGGVFFAFVGLPHLGLTYTPTVLGGINFLVAIILLWAVWSELTEKLRKNLLWSIIVIAVVLFVSGLFSQRIVEWGDKIRYKDRVVYSEQSRYQKIVLTYGEGDYWLFLNGHQQLSTMDEPLYHEPLVHPVVLLHPNPKKVLVLGGGDGAAVRELLKYDGLEKIVLVDLDPEVTELASTHAVLLNINGGSLLDPKVQVINQDGFTFLESNKNEFDVIIADFPDPRTVDLGRLYSREFYWLCHQSLNAEGLMVTQAGSPYYAEKAYKCINETMKAAGFNTLKLHNQVLTLGEWGWIIGSVKQRPLKEELQEEEIPVPTQWLNQSALTMISSFGKTVFKGPIGEVRINRLHDPVLYRYYNAGKWDLY